MDRKKKTGLILLGILPSALAGRGIHTFLTGEYHGQPRLGGKIDLIGFEAYMMGSGYLCLALLICSAMLIELGISKKLVLALSIVFLAGAAVSFVNAF